MDQLYDFAYIAGYFDGDGCFSCEKYFDKRKNKFFYRIRIRISSTNEKVFDFIKHHFNGFITKNKKRKSFWKDQYVFVINNQIDCLYFIEKIKSFLIEKKNQAEILIKFHASNDTIIKDSYKMKLHSIKEFNDLVQKQDKEFLMSIKNTQIPSISDYAYFAGFIDAECCLKTIKSTCKSNRFDNYKIYLCCNNTKLPVFKWIVTRFGGNIYFVSRKAKNSKYRDQLQWYISSKALANILLKIYPFLKYKKTVCAKLIKFYKTSIPNGGDRKTEAFKLLYSKVLKKRDILVNQIHKLNHKGL